MDEQLLDQLLRQAFRYEDPESYRAGVETAFAALATAVMEPREQHEVPAAS